MAENVPESPQPEAETSPEEQQQREPDLPQDPEKDDPAEPEKPSPEPQPQPPPQPAPQSQTKPPPVTSDGAQAAPPAAKGPPSSTPAVSSGPPPPETPQEKKAKDCIAQAEKKVRSAQSFLGGLFGGATKMEDAADLYVRAANFYKVAKKWRASGDAFCSAADIQMKLDVKHEAGANLVEAGQVLKKEDPKRAVGCYLQAAEIYTDMGRFSMAARYHNNVAEICEGELQEFDKAITHYEQAADYYKGEDSTGSANRCLLKVAHMSALLQHFDKAAGIFEEVGRNSLENTLLKYSAKDHFFKAAVCRFCIGAEDARDAIEGYKQIHPGFEGTRELKLVQDLLEAHSEEDPDRFADIVKDYDAISRIDQWLTAQLLHIKKSITSSPDIN